MEPPVSTTHTVAGGRRGIVSAEGSPITSYSASCVAVRRTTFSSRNTWLRSCCAPSFATWHERRESREVEKVPPRK
jgi:hypothetical protein